MRWTNAQLASVSLSLIRLWLFSQVKGLEFKLKYLLIKGSKFPLLKILLTCPLDFAISKSIVYILKETDHLFKELCSLLKTKTLIGIAHSILMTKLSLLPSVFKFYMWLRQIEKTRGGTHFWMPSLGNESFHTILAFWSYTLINVDCCSFKGKK